MLWVRHYSFHEIQGTIAKPEFKQYVVFENCNVDDEQVSILT